MLRSTTTSPHIVNGNPADVGEEVYDDIVETGGKTDVVPVVNKNITNAYEGIVVGVRGIRPLSMYPTDSYTPRFTPNEGTGHGETNIYYDYNTSSGMRDQ